MPQCDFVFNSSLLLSPHRRSEQQPTVREANSSQTGPAANCTELGDSNCRMSAFHRRPLVCRTPRPGDVRLLLRGLPGWLVGRRVRLVVVVALGLNNETAA